MSIVVTCACTQTYRLPNRYAGKRCKCRECGERIKVPASSSEEVRPAKRKTKKRKRARAKTRAEASRDTTRRLGVEAGTIIGEGRQLREGLSRRRPVSESIHQLSPLHSQTFDDDAVGAPSRRLKKKKKKSKSKKRVPETRRKAKRSTEERATPAKPKTRKPKKDKKAKKPKKDKKAKKSKKTKDEKPSKAKKASKGKVGAKGKAKVAPKGRGRAGRSTAKLGRRDRDERATRGRPRSSAAARRRGRRDGDEDAPRTRKSPTRHALMAVIAIVGVLCLGIGLIVGGAFSDGTGSGAKSDVETKLSYLEQLTFKQQWDAALAEADKLEAEFANDAQAKAKLFKMRRGIDAMSQIAKVDDPEAKLRNLLNFVRDKSPAVRLAVSLGLRKVAEADEAQRALLALTKDEDARVAEASRMGMVHIGGKHSIPFLIEVIEQTAETGGKLGDLAVDQALQIHDPEVAKVLVKILEVRKKAKPTLLRRVLNKLSEVASDPKHAEAAKPYTSHEDKGVKEAAEAVVAALS